MGDLGHRLNLGNSEVGGPTLTAGGSHHAANLTALYEGVRATGELPPEVWDEWLWKTDPEEALNADVQLNRCQLLGFLVCLCRGMEHLQDEGGQAAKTMGSGDAHERLVLMDRPVYEMTLRELKDTVENLQIEWPQFLGRLSENPNAQRNLDAVLVLIDQCVARFGALCIHAHPQAVLDDLGSVESVPSAPELFRITPACIRRIVCTFFVLYRHLHLLSVCKEVCPEWRDPGITKYHMEASSDDFNLLCMHLALPVAAKLNYRHDFPGMYNHVSQVVFFHNSEYQRIPRAALDALGAAGVEHVLPALMQLYPDIRLLYEDDRMDLSDTAPPASDWFWLVVAGRVYLVDPRRAVWYSRDATSLLRVYLAARGGCND